MDEKPVKKFSNGEAARRYTVNAVKALRYSTSPFFAGVNYEKHTISLGINLISGEAYENDLDDADFSLLSYFFNTAFIEWIKDMNEKHSVPDFRGLPLTPDTAKRVEEYYNQINKKEALGPDCQTIVSKLIGFFDLIPMETF